MLLRAPLLVKHAKVLASKSSPSLSVMKRSFLTISDTEDEVPSPLLDLKEMAMKFNYCDENGFRKPDQHWSFVISACESYDAVSKQEFKNESCLSSRKSLLTFLRPP